jgi:hypothetical protein
MTVIYLYFDLNHAIGILHTDLFSNLYFIVLIFNCLILCYIRR